VRTRSAVVDAARTLFLRDGYSRTTMEEIAALAGVTKRTLYNNYADKEALFTQIVLDFIAFAEEFARGLHEELAAGVTGAKLRGALEELGVRLALAITRREVIALRRLLIAEAREFPALARKYFARVPGQVLGALAVAFEQLDEAGQLRVPDARLAASQFAYLVVGEPLDRAMLVGTTPSRKHVVTCARAGVETFLARYG
jgi:TetR/AcrR family transcriptional repressor of mexJK operon